jgi:hypothetical protein
MIVSHIERAIPLGHFLTEERTLSQLLGNVMARAGFGLALVTADRRIVYANDTADTLMRARNGLRCERNCIVAANSTTSRKLQSLMTPACRQTGGRSSFAMNTGWHRSSCMSCPSARVPLLLRPAGTPLSLALSSMIASERFPNVSVPLRISSP